MTEKTDTPATETPLKEEPIKATTPSEEALTTRSDNSEQWNALLAEEDDPELVVASDEDKSKEAAAQPAEAAAAQPAAPAVEVEKPAAQPTPPLEKPAAVPPTVAKETEKPAAPPETPPVINEEEEVAKRKKWRDDSEQRLATVMAGRMTEEEIEALRLEPEKVLPRLLARASMDMYDAMMGNVFEQMPRVISMHEQQRQQAQAAEQAFYQAWPQLQKPEYAEVVQRTVQTYRQINPKAPFEQAVKEAGAMAMVALRLPLEAEKPAAPAAPVAPAAPAYTPASPGSKSAGGAKPTDNPFTQLADEMLIEGD